MLSCFLISTVWAGAAQPPADHFRGGTVDWARLRSSDPSWNRHMGNDPALLDFMRDHTTLNIKSNGNSARATSLDELCAFPFIYAQSIADLTPPEMRNLAEYLRRGGFLFVDACRNEEVTPNPYWFLRTHIALLKAQFPDLRVQDLNAKHEVFSIYFQMPEYPPYRHSDGPEPLRGLYVGDRMIGIISLTGFQCGWSGYGDPPLEDEYGNLCMQMVTNIYIYAMTR